MARLRPISVPIDTRLGAGTRVHKGERRISQERIDEMIKLATKGYNVTRVAKTVGVSWETARGVLFENRDAILNFREKLKEQTEYKLRGLALEIMNSITPEEYKKLKADKRGWLVGTCLHNAQLLSGGSTENVQLMSDTDLSREIKKLKEERRRIESKSGRVVKD